MSKTLIELLAWADNVNAKSPAKTKKLQKQLAAEIGSKVLGASGPSPLTVGEPTSFSIETASGVSSRRHFIGGEEVHFSGISVTARTYKIMLEFTPDYVSDVRTIKVSLKQALDLISGLEIRMLAAEGLAAMVERAYELNGEFEVKKVDRTGSQYDAIGYGSW